MLKNCFKLATSFKTFIPVTSMVLLLLLVPTVQVRAEAHAVTSYEKEAESSFEITFALYLSKQPNPL